MSSSALKNGNDDYFVCPHCGAEVSHKARACPECGADDETGWAEDADKWRADIPTGYGGDDDFDYDEYVRREFGADEGRILGLPAGLFFLLVVLLFVSAIVALIFLTR